MIPGVDSKVLLAMSKKKGILVYRSKREISVLLFDIINIYYAQILVVDIFDELRLVRFVRERRTRDVQAMHGHVHDFTMI